MHSSGDIVKDLNKLHDDTKTLRGLLDPFETPLITRYKSPGRFITSLPFQKFYGWSFEHGWTVEFIRRKHIDFRQQFACLLLAYCAPLGTLPELFNSPWPVSQPPPTQLLKSFRYGVPGIFERSFSSTINRVVDNDSANGWTAEDATAFKILKAAFFDPFKSPQKLTGPLLAVWAEDNRHSVDDAAASLLYNLSARGGVGWCKVEGLVSLHDLIELHRNGDTENHKNDSLRVILNPIEIQGELIGATVQILNCYPDFVRHVASLQEPSDVKDIGSDAYFGNLNMAVRGVVKCCKPMATKFDTVLGRESASLTVVLTPPLGA